MKIVFVIKALSSEGGGAERVLVEVASGLARRGHSVTVVTSDAIGAVSFYPLDPWVRQINLGIGQVAHKTNAIEALKRVFAMRRVIANIKPDVVVGFMNSSYMLLFFALKGLQIPLIASEHVGPEYYETRPLQRFLSHFMPLVAEKIVVVTEQVKIKFPIKVHGVVSVIPNPVCFELGSRADLCGATDSPKILLAIGSLNEGKNHRGLIAAFHQIADAVPDWNLRIVGEGELRAELDALIRALHFEGRVQLSGATKEIWNEYLNAQLFVSSSTYESFGLVVAEALIHGLPVVGFADCPGINLLVRHNENGLLVDGEDRVHALAKALESLMLDTNERSRLGSAPADWLVQQYDINYILDLWEQLLHDCIEPQPC
ncbi:MAG: glycosyltransferase family 4 protein [Gallionella sp.]|nr:glycosyltransferase family 4 protein [Gallionella sp.]MDD4946745.1 glycosyltransferase family 4 protein [Gallionella sp.]